MAFPIDPSVISVGARGLFVVQDPELRLRVLPLFSFNPDATHERRKAMALPFASIPGRGAQRPSMCSKICSR